MKAAWALGELGPIASNAIPSLIDAMDDPASNVEILAIQSLEKIAPEQVDAIPKLLSRLGDSNPGVSNSAADLLNKIEKARKARNLATYSNEYEFDMAFLHSTSQRARLFGLLRLMHFSVPDERVDSTLKALLTDTNSMIREQTAIFLKNPSMGFSDSSVPVNGGYRTGNEVR